MGFGILGLEFRVEGLRLRPPRPLNALEGFRIQVCHTVEATIVSIAVHVLGFPFEHFSENRNYNLDYRYPGAPYIVPLWN